MSDTPKEMSLNIAPGYPEDLHVHPESYTIYLPEEKWHPLSAWAAEVEAGTDTGTVEPVSQIDGEEEF